MSLLRYVEFAVLPIKNITSIYYNYAELQISP